MQWCLTDSGKYRIESLSPSTFPGALNVIRTAFCQDEAVAIGSEVNLNPEASEELLELCAYAALDGVSLVAVEISSGEIAAASFNKIQIPPTNTKERTFFEVFAEERCKQESSRSLIRFMANVDERCNLFEKYKADCSLEIMFLATLREHRQEGLAKLLCKVSMQLAQKLRLEPISTINPHELGAKYSHIPPSSELKTFPKICQAIFTSSLSQKITHSLGFTVDVSVPYTEFIYDGKTFASRIGPSSPNCEVVSKVISHQ